MAREKRDAVTSIRLFPSMKARIEEQADKRGVKFSEWVEEALERSLRSAEDTYPEDDIVNFDYMEGMRKFHLRMTSSRSLGFDDLLIPARMPIMRVIKHRLSYCEITKA